MGVDLGPQRLRLDIRGWKFKSIGEGFQKAEVIAFSPFPHMYPD